MTLPIEDTLKPKTIHLDFINQVHLAAAEPTSFSPVIFHRDLLDAPQRLPFLPVRNAGLCGTKKRGKTKTRDHLQLRTQSTCTARGTSGQILKIRCSRESLLSLTVFKHLPLEVTLLRVVVRTFHTVLESFHDARAGRDLNAFASRVRLRCSTASVISSILLRVRLLRTTTATTTPKNSAIDSTSDRNTSSGRRNLQITNGGELGDQKRAKSVIPRRQHAHPTT